MNVAVLIIGMGNLSGAGGAERFFADLFDAFNSQTNPKRKFFFISDDLSPLHQIGRLNTFPENQLIFKSYRRSFFYEFTRNRPRIDKYVNRLRTYLTAKSLEKLLKKHTIKALHLPVYEDKDFSLMKAMDELPNEIRPKIIIVITHSVVQNHYFDDDLKHAYYSKLNYGRLFEQVKVDGVYTWYKAFREFAEEHKIVKSNPIIHNISSRFTSTEFHEEYTDRENKIIYSGRLTIYKDPFLFVKAAEIVLKTNPNCGWKFEMYGKGPLEKELREYMRTHQLSELISLGFNSDMPSILRKSKIYISSQNMENFPSLSVAEAMACCNLIIARDVGQTNLYVKHGVNGFLLNTGTPEELAELLLKLIKDSTSIPQMARESVKLLKEVHNKENFIDEIEEFWKKLNI